MGKKARFSRSRQSEAAGMAPGTAFFIGEQKREHIRIDIIDYNEAALIEHTETDLQKCSELAQAQTVTWINISGIHDMALVESLGKHFHLHPLTVEDIVNTNQRPKAETFPDYLYVVLKMINFNEEKAKVEVEHVSLILGENYVISLLEDSGDVFDEVRGRLRGAKGRIRKLGADFLAYTLMDAVVDNYFLCAERIGDVIETIDERIITDPQPGDIQEIHRLKRDILRLRKAVWPLREEVSLLGKTESALIHPETRLFLRDVYDNTIQVIDMVETYRDILGGMHDTYLSTISNRMNEIMKMLTIIATIFIPLTFIVGVYGMNFHYMPELDWHWGYPMVWGFMISIGVGMVLYFRRRGWL